MSEIEDLVRQHTESVNEALSGFEGQITTINDAIAALQAEGSRIIPAASRRGGPIELGPRGEIPTIASATIGARLTINDAERDVVAAIMRGRVTNAMREASDPDGGYLVPEVMRAQIEALVLRQSPMRRVARIVDFTSSRTVIPINTRGAEAGWVDEDDDRVETKTPGLAAITPPGGTLYALPSATEELVEDAIVNLEGFLEENVVDAMAEKESQAFIAGDGKNKPAGFLSPANPAPSLAGDANRELYSIQYIPSDSPGGDVGQTILANLVAMVFALKAGYRQAPGTAWLASTDFIARVARVKDGDGKPIYLPSLREDVPGTLLGYPVIE
ncbi:MAG: phage major capsid protein, partial [Sphingomonadales bacterium]|nr:phage major capsid protein [Sphingomonadales bacterium]